MRIHAACSEASRDISFFTFVIERRSLVFAPQTAFFFVDEITVIYIFKIFPTDTRRAYLSIRLYFRNIQTGVPNPAGETAVTVVGLSPEAERVGARELHRLVVQRPANDRNIHVYVSERSAK